MHYGIPNAYISCVMKLCKYTFHHFYYMGRETAFNILIKPYKMQATEAIPSTFTKYTIGTTCDIGVFIAVTT